MELDSKKQVLKMGVLSGICTYLLYVIFVVVIGMMTKWQGFWEFNEETKTLALVPNSVISWEMTNAIGLILASLVPVFLMRYEKIRYAFSFIGISLLVLIWLFGATLGAYYMIGDMKNTMLFCPFSTFDAFYYLIFVFLLGSAIGTLVSFVVNLMRNKD